ncbi:MAG: hypothetical protein WBO44_12230 [Saprospiraceae bacterium]
MDPAPVLFIDNYTSFFEIIAGLNIAVSGFEGLRNYIEKKSAEYINLADELLVEYSFFQNAKNTTNNINVQPNLLNEIPESVLFYKVRLHDVFKHYKKANDCILYCHIWSAILMMCLLFDIGCHSNCSKYNHLITLINITTLIYLFLFVSMVIWTSLTQKELIWFVLIVFIICISISILIIKGFSLNIFSEYSESKFISASTFVGLFPFLLTIIWTFQAKIQPNKIVKKHKIALENFAKKLDTGIDSI